MKPSYLALFLVASALVPSALRADQVGGSALQLQLERSRIAVAAGRAHADQLAAEVRTLGAAVNSIAAHEPPGSWNRQDPADSIYRAARGALNRGSYSQAAFLFQQIYGRYPKSTYTPDAYYWEALARYRSGARNDLAAARTALNLQRETYPSARTRDDAGDLLARINARLAQRGDAQAAAEVESVAAAAAGESRSSSRRGSVGQGVAVNIASSRPGQAGRRGGGECSDDDDDDEKMAALNALLQMDEDRALPILKKVMARRDAGSTCLRRKAVFLISQHPGPDAETMLLTAVRSDPDDEVREQAVFWLGQAGGERAAGALDSILRTSSDEAVQEKAIFALSQNDSPKALQSLRDYAVRAGAPTSLRENAIFWLGQSHRAENAGFLRGIYKSTKEESLKEKIIFSIAQGGGKDTQRWLAEIAADAGEDIEMRKKAIFWLGQSGGASLPELVTLYDKMPDREIREQLIFAYSQRHDRGATDKLIEIAKTEKDRELRKKALFWLSQSRDPRVAEILEDILSKP